jgi:hypothetical protein
LPHRAPCGDGIDLEIFPDRETAIETHVLERPRDPLPCEFFRPSRL